MCKCREETIWPWYHLNWNIQRMRSRPRFELSGGGVSRLLYRITGSRRPGLGQPYYHMILILLLTFLTWLLYEISPYFVYSILDWFCAALQLLTNFKGRLTLFYLLHMQRRTVEVTIAFKQDVHPFQIRNSFAHFSLYSLNDLFTHFFSRNSRDIASLFNTLRSIYVVS
jgi:hypothetical protein